MGVIALVAVMATLAVPAATASSGAEEKYPSGHPCYGVQAKDAWPIARRAWKRIDGPRGRERARYREVWRCLEGDARDRARNKWRNAKRRFEPVRERKKKRREERQLVRSEANAYGDIDPPGEEWLYRTRMCESGGDYSTNTGNGFTGAYQFMDSTWRSVGGSTSSAYLASPAEQDYRAAVLYRRSGPGQWPVCGSH